jgi:hypothetical protein
LRHYTKAKFDAERRERMEKMAGANLYIKNLEVWQCRMNR